MRKPAPQFCNPIPQTELLYCAVARFFGVPYVILAGYLTGCVGAEPAFSGTSWTALTLEVGK